MAKPINKQRLIRLETFLEALEANRSMDVTLPKGLGAEGHVLQLVSISSMEMSYLDCHSLHISETVNFGEPLDRPDFKGAITYSNMVDALSSLGLSIGDVFPMGFDDAVLEENADGDFGPARQNRPIKLSAEVAGAIVKSLDDAMKIVDDLGHNQTTEKDVLRSHLGYVKEQLELGQYNARTLRTILKEAADYAKAHGVEAFHVIAALWNMFNG